MPLGKFPKDEARKFVDQWARALQQLDFGARRQTCNWAYTLPEQREDFAEILLPDVNESRRWIRLLGLKVRVEIAEGNLDAAARTLATGLSL